MADRPRRPTDPGLFLKHFNSGRELYDAGSLPEAERQLEEAYLLRPRDHKVLNLLGLVYFKQEKYEKAEEIYRKLATESPDAHTLFYNLGLIYFKLGRLEDAELAFLKALDLHKDNPKINFYLGSIYEKLRRFQDAIFQYRQAGANIMVRRVEDKLGPPRQKQKTKPAADDDTAEFHGGEVEGQLAANKPRSETEPLLVAPKRVGPVSDVLLADKAPTRRPGPSPKPPTGGQVLDDTRPPETLPPGPRPVSGGARPDGAHDIVAFLAGLPAATEADKERTGVTGISSGPGPYRREPPTPPPGPAPAAHPFRLLQRNLLEATFSGKLFVKQGTIYSYSGNLTFWVKEKRPGSGTALVIITGTGKVLLTDRDRDLSLLTVGSEPIHVQPALLLGCEESLTPRYVRVGEGAEAPEFLTLDGQGVTAVSVGQRALTLSVSPDLPVSVAPHALIMWSGDLSAEHVLDAQLSEVMAAPRAGAGMIRLTGSGRVVVEQVV